MAASQLNAGDRISEYILEARIGQGTFGEVWRARHHVFNERVAIKVPTDPDYIKNLQSEGVIQHDVVNAIYHANINRGPAARAAPSRVAKVAAASRGGNGKKQVAKVGGRKIGRNDPCPCGSGKKYKHCCGR